MSVLRKSQLSSGKTVARTGAIRKGQLSTDQSISTGASGRVGIGRNRLSDIRRERAVDIGVRDDRRLPPRIIIPPTLPSLPIGTPLPPDYKDDPLYRGEDFTKTLPREPIIPDVVIPPPDLPPPLETPGYVRPKIPKVPLEDIEMAHTMRPGAPGYEEWLERRKRDQLLRPIIGGEEEGWGGRLIGEIRPRTIMPVVTGGGILRPVSIDPVTPLGKKTVIRGDGVVARVRGVGAPVVVGGNGGAVGGFAGGLGKVVSSITSPENRTMLYVLIGAVAVVGFIAMRK